jgi:dihydrodipicolinate synthase/N-acetylneuraminate lyase
MENSSPSNPLRAHLLEGQVIPAMPLALDAQRCWSAKHQQALIRYYCDAGAGGLAVGVHSTQFEIREPRVGLFEPVLDLAAHVIDRRIAATRRQFVKIAGICGLTAQAAREADLAARLGYNAGLLSLAAFKQHNDDAMIEHCRVVADIIPIVGFYLQPAVGGRLLGYDFWRRFAEIPNVVAVKIAPFNRYQTWDVVRAVMDSGRADIALYTGNDDNIILDLLTPWEHRGQRRFIVGGLLGQFGVWTRRAVEMLEAIKGARNAESVSGEWLARNVALTDANAAIFDAAHYFAGCLPGIHEILRRQGLLPTNYCLNSNETLSPGQAEELTRVSQAYPWLVDDEFVAAHREAWLTETDA